MSRLISVIPVFNGARHIAATLESLARQNLRPNRVIIQDNGSTDNTREVVEPYVREHGFEWSPSSVLPRSSCRVSPASR